MTTATAPIGFLTVRDFAARVGVSLSTAYRLVERGDIPSAKVGGSYKIHPDVVERVVAESLGVEA